MGIGPAEIMIMCVIAFMIWGGGKLPVVGERLARSLDGRSARLDGTSLLLLAIAAIAFVMWVGALFVDAHR